MEELTAEFIVPYIFYGAAMVDNSTKEILQLCGCNCETDEAIVYINDELEMKTYNLSDLTLALRPITSITDPIPGAVTKTTTLHMFPKSIRKEIMYSINKAVEEMDPLYIANLPYTVLDILIKLRFDVFLLIPRKYAIEESALG